MQIPRGFDVEGVVRDAHGAPVAGATVWFGRMMEPSFPVATSAPDGSFTVRSFWPFMNLWARADGHAPTLARSLRHPEGIVVQETLVLRGAGATVSGRVLDAEGLPVAGAQVLVDGQEMMQVETPPAPVGQMVVFGASCGSGAHSGPV